MPTAGCDATKRGRFPAVSQTDLLESNVPPKENVNTTFLIFKSCHSKQWRGECGKINNLYYCPWKELVAMLLSVPRHFSLFHPHFPPFPSLIFPSNVQSILSSDNISECEVMGSKSKYFPAKGFPILEAPLNEWAGTP